MKIVIYTNQKGGVGKSTTCREEAFFLAHKGFKVLVIDCDSQGNITKSMTDEENFKGLYDALETGEVAIREFSPNLFLLGGDFRLSLLEKRYIGELDAYTKFKDLLSREEFSRFDFVFFDTPPSLQVLTLNAMAVSYYFIIPMKPALYSLQGCNDLMEVVSKVKRNLNPNLSLLGVIINEFNSLPIITRQIRDEIIQSFGNVVFDGVLSRSVRIEEAIAQRTGVIHLSNAGRIKDEVEAIGSEMLKRMGVGDGN